MLDLYPPHPAWIEIDLVQFKKNISTVRHLIGDILYCLPVKADAYGHGLCRIGKLAEEAGVDYLAVAHLSEGFKLRQAGLKIPILVLGAIHENQIIDLINLNLEFSISSHFKAALVGKKCQEIGKKCRVHLEVDTGMRRTGVRPSTAITLFQYMESLGCFDIVGIYSHLAIAEEQNNPFTKRQIEIFQELLKHRVFKGKSLIRHLANSKGTVYFPDSHLDMVRPSMLTFGYESTLDVKPCFLLKARISYFKVIEAGDSVGYNQTFVTPKRTNIITVPIGYGDGYRRSLSNRGFVLIRGRRFPVIGSICMDQLMVDIGEHEAYVEDEVVLIGRQGEEEISLVEFANLCDTIPYEVLCFFNQRLPRVYTSIPR